MGHGANAFLILNVFVGEKNFSKYLLLFWGFRNFSDCGRFFSISLSTGLFLFLFWEMCSTKYNFRFLFTWLQASFLMSLILSAANEEEGWLITRRSCGIFGQKVDVNITIPSDLETLRVSFFLERLTGHPRESFVTAPFQKLH